MTVIYLRNSSHFCQKYGKWFSVARIALLCIHICGLSRKVNTNKIKLAARCDLFRFSFIAQIIVFLCSELRNIEFLVIMLCSSNFRSSIFLLMRLIYQNILHWKTYTGTVGYFLEISKVEVFNSVMVCPEKGKKNIRFMCMYLRAILNIRGWLAWRNTIIGFAVFLILWPIK